MPKIKKKIKVEKFSSFTFIVILGIFLGLIITAYLNINFNEYLPKTNFWGEKDLIKERKTLSEIPYNQGDFLTPFFVTFSIAFSSLIMALIINIFRKDFFYNFKKNFGYIDKDNKKSGLYAHYFWLFWLLGFPIFISLVRNLHYGSIYFINSKFETSLPNFIGIFIVFIILFLSAFLIDLIHKNKKK